MIEKVISGGQTGADLAGWRAARAAGILCGGWMPRGFITEDGRRPEFAGLYGAKEHPSHGYPPRTKSNVYDADLTLWFGDHSSPGGRVTRNACIEYGKRMFVVVDTPACPPIAIVGLLREHESRVLNIAGNRESSAPGIGAWVEVYLTEVFRIMRESS